MCHLLKFSHRITSGRIGSAHPVHMMGSKILPVLWISNGRLHANNESRRRREQGRIVVDWKILFDLLGGLKRQEGL